MNTPNNKSRRESQRKIETAFIKLLQDKEVNQIRVTDICKSAGVNRTTFYANYEDIYALGEAVKRRLEEEVMGLYQEEQERQRSDYNEHNFLKLFYHIKENQLFYKTYFKLSTDGELRIIGYDVREAMAYYNNQHIDYHIAFFGNGLNAVIKMWLQNGCQETPEEIFSIIQSEYMKMRS